MQPVYNRSYHFYCRCNFVNPITEPSSPPLHTQSNDYNLSSPDGNARGGRMWCMIRQCRCSFLLLSSSFFSFLFSWPFSPPHKALFVAFCSFSSTCLCIYPFCLSGAHHSFIPLARKKLFSGEKHLHTAWPAACSFLLCLLTN
jgi:hypothetical protein